MNKILIFEDEWQSVKGCFEAANILYFENNLKFIVKSKSQDVDLDEISNEYIAVFIDLTLATNSRMDGLSIYKSIQDKNSFDMSKVFFLTGNNDFIAYCENRGLVVKESAVIIKPISFLNIHEKIKKLYTPNDIIK